jgi:hypothetical protein
LGATPHATITARRLARAGGGLLVACLRTVGNKSDLDEILAGNIEEIREGVVRLVLVSTAYPQVRGYLLGSSLYRSRALPISFSSTATTTRR